MDDNGSLDSNEIGDIVVYLNAQDSYSEELKNLLQTLIKK